MRKLARDFWACLLILGVCRGGRRHGGVRTIAEVVNGDRPRIGVGRGHGDGFRRKVGPPADGGPHLRDQCAADENQVVVMNNAASVSSSRCAIGGLLVPLTAWLAVLLPRSEKR